MAARRIGRRWTRIVIGACAVIAGGWSLSVVCVVLWGRTDRAQRADAIVVLGAAQYVGRPSPVLRARLDHAVALWQRGYAPLLILTGGTGHGDTTSEAAVGRKYALSRGVPEEALLSENRGRTTSESMRAVAAIMRSRGLHRAILVSDPFHMLRLSILARRFSLTAYSSPTPTSPISANRSERLRYVFGESLKVPLTYVFERPD